MIAISELTYTYPDAELPALTDVGLEIAAGEFVLLVGASGSGKSTLLRAIAGLVPHFHGGRFAGRVRIGGHDTRETRPAQLSARVGSLFQDPETQVVMGTVAAELAFALENHGWSPAAVARGVEEIAQALGIAHLLERSTAELSGGELQRVALGATLAVRPAVVCLDEPTSQLDPVAGDELIGLLRRLHEDAELTVVLSEHRIERCLPAADRVIALAAGAVAFDGTPEHFLAWADRAAPALSTPGARLLRRAGLPPVPGVRRARAALRAAQVDITGLAAPAPPVAAASGPEVVLDLDDVWHELRAGPTVLSGIDLRIHAGERVALMGANGAGKSTLLRHIAGLLAPTRGAVRTPAGRVGLLLQNPNDYLIHDRVSAEAPPEALARFGLAHLGDRHPRDLSGGERQRLALAVVWGNEAPALLCLDEPTRGMDREHRGELVARLTALEGATLVATHDPEFAARCADRVLLLARGRLIADGPPAEILAGGTYFATEAARITDGAVLVP